MNLSVERMIVATLVVIGLTFFLTIILFPFYWLLTSSMKGLGSLFAWPPELLPRGFNFSAYSEVLFHYGLLGCLKNSTLVALATASLTVSLSLWSAYAVTRLHFRGKKFMSRSILLVYLLPAITLVIPLYVLMSYFGLRDNLGGLILIYLSQTLPAALYMLKNYFEQLPVELEEAALIDGCSRLGSVWRIVIPISVPAVVSVALYTFISAWNEFLFAFIFLDSAENFTLPIGIVRLYTGYQTAWDKVMAAAVIITIPVVVIFLVFERYLIRGLTAGSVKG